MSGLLAAAVLLAPCAAADSGTAEIRGRVRDATARAPVAHAVVEVRAGDGLRRARTGSGGRYRVAGLPPGWLTVTVRHQGYRESRVQVRVGRGQCLDVDFTVELDPVEMPALRVDGLPSGGPVEVPDGGVGGRLAARPGPGAPELEALRATPLGGSGLGRAVRRSVRSGPADPSALYLRGTTGPFKQILLDGAPVQTPFHLDGLMASHPPGVLGSSRLRSGGPEPRIGGGLLYTLDLETRSPGDEGRAAGSVDLLGASARASGPVAGGSYLASGRALHPGRGPGGGGSPEGRRYADGLLRLSAGGEGGPRGSVTGFWNRASTPLVGSGGTVVEADWENAAGSARLATGSRTRGWRAVLAASRYRSGLPLRGEGAPASRVSASVGEQRLLIRREGEAGDLAWSAGGALRRKAQRLVFGGDAVAGAAADGGAAHRAGGFASARLHLSESVSLRGGLRADRFSPDGSTRASPRASATVRVAPRTSVRLSAGRVHQLLAGWSTEEASAAPGGGDAGVGDPPGPRVAGATRMEVRLEHRGEDGLQLGTEGHFRRLDGVSASALFDTVAADSAGTFRPLESGGDEGGVYSSGLELWGAWSRPDVRLWASYSLTWLWGAPDASGLSRRFAARQVLSGGGDVSLPAGFRARASLSGSWGLPMTPLPVTESTSGPAGGIPTTGSGADGGERDRTVRERASPYVRLDARIERAFSADLLGGSVDLTPYAELINALDRENSLFHRVPAEGGSLQPVNPVPMLPVVGVSFRVPAAPPSGTR